MEKNFLNQKMSIKSKRRISEKPLAKNMPLFFLEQNFRQNRLQYFQQNREEYFPAKEKAIFFAK